MCPHRSRRYIHVYSAPSENPRSATLPIHVTIQKDRHFRFGAVSRCEEDDPDTLLSDRQVTPAKHYWCAADFWSCIAYSIRKLHDHAMKQVLSGVACIANARYCHLLKVKEEKKWRICVRVGELKIQRSLLRPPVELWTICWTIISNYRTVSLKQPGSQTLVTDITLSLSGKLRFLRWDSDAIELRSLSTALVMCLLRYSSRVLQMPVFDHAALEYLQYERERERGRERDRLSWSYSKVLLLNRWTDTCF